jgi:hypothetical protein
MYANQTARGGDSLYNLGMANSRKKTGASKRTGNYQREYFRVRVTYTDNEFSGRVFKSREAAEKFAARQKKSPAVKSVKVQSFIKDRYAWQASRKKKKSDAK